MASRKRTNTPGAAEQALRSVKNAAKAGSYKVSQKSKESQSYDEIVRSVVQEIRAAQADSGNYSRALLSQSIDNILDRVVYELDERESSQSFTDDQLDAIKEQVSEAMSEQSLTKDDMEALKEGVASVVQTLSEQSSSGESFAQSSSPESASSEEAAEEEAPIDEESSGLTYADKAVQSADDEQLDAKAGATSATKYRDSKVAQNFAVLQNYVDEQFRLMEANIGQMTTFGGVKAFIAAGFEQIQAGIVRLSGGIASFTKGTVSRLVGLTKAVGGGVFSGIAKTVSGLAKGMGAVLGGIRGLGSRIGGAIASPFKAMGGFFSGLFGRKKSKSDEKKEAKKQALRDKMMDVIMKVVDKIWNFVEPVLDWLTGAIKKFVIIPITMIAIKIGLIIAGVVALGVLAYLAISWVVEKVKKFWNYVVSGEMWDDIMGALTKAWEWLKDFGKWLWDLTCDVFKYVFWGVWVDIGKWIWDKLCEFGQWLYDKYIFPYVIEPFRKYVWEPLKTLWNEKVWPVIRPFVESVQNLVQRIKDVWKNFNWDENKSFFENLKCIASIVTDAVLDWWNSSPFKTFYETYLEPFVNDIRAFVGRITQAFSEWDTNKSIWENLKNIGGIIRESIKEWWEDSTIKKYYDKYIRPVVEKVQSVVIDSISKLGDMVWSLPFVGSFRPFGFLVGKGFKLSDAEEEEYKEVESKNKEAAEAAAKADELDAEIADLSKKVANGEKGWFGGTYDEDLAAAIEKQRKLREKSERLGREAAQKADEIQRKNAAKQAETQVGPAMRQLDEAQQARQDAGVELSEEAKLYSAQAAQEKQAQQDRGSAQDMKLNSILDVVNNISSRPVQAVDKDEIAGAAAAGGMAGGVAGKWGRIGYKTENR